MEARTSPVVRMLAVIAAVAVLIAGIALAADYQRHMPERERWVVLMPKCQRGFGRDNLAAIAYSLRLFRDKDYGRWPERYRLGPLSVRIK